VTATPADCALWAAVALAVAAAPRSGLADGVCPGIDQNGVIVRLTNFHHVLPSAFEVASYSLYRPIPDGLEGYFACF
jgi:hypothetical protein